MMARAMIEGWLAETPAEQRKLRADLYAIASDPGERAADRIAAIKALMHADFTAARMEQDAEQPPQTNIHVSVASQQNLADAAEILKRLGLARATDTLLPAHADPAPVGIHADG